MRQSRKIPPVLVGCKAEIKDYRSHGPRYLNGKVGVITSYQYVGRIPMYGVQFPSRKKVYYYWPDQLLIVSLPAKVG